MRFLSILSMAVLLLSGCQNNHVSTVGVTVGVDPSTGAVEGGVEVGLKDPCAKTKSVKVRAGDNPCKRSIESKFRNVFRFGCCPTYSPPDTSPVPVFVPPAVATPSDPVAPAPTPAPIQPVVASTDSIGALDPAQPLTAADQAIINSVLNGPKTLDIQPNRVLLAGDNYPQTQSQLTYCVFDTTVRDLLGLAKKFNVAPSDMRALRDSECTKANMVKYIDWVFDSIHPGDTRIVCISSHGTTDTAADGSIQGLVCTYDMVATMNWSDQTEISLDYWKEKCKSVPDGCNVVLIFDCCYAGADIRALMAHNSHQLKARSIDGPPIVQARVAAATKRSLMRDVNQYNVQFFPMCLDSELSEEGEITGGMGTWSLWSAVDKDGATAPCTAICRDANAYSRSMGATQHITILGKNAKAPMSKAAVQ